MARKGPENKSDLTPSRLLFVVCGSQLVERLDRCNRCRMSGGWIRTCGNSRQFGPDCSETGHTGDDEPVYLRERIPRTGRGYVCLKCQHVAVSPKGRLVVQVAPALAAAASIVGLCQLLMVSRIPSSSSPLVVNPVTLFPSMIDFPVVGSMIPGNMAPPWQL